MRSFSLLLILILSGIRFSYAQDIFVCRNAAVSFYSSAPIEDIYAETNKAVSAVNMLTGSIYFKVPIRTFQFPKSLMQEHFNTDYLESDQYPFAEFKGAILHYKKPEHDGTYHVTAAGKLTIHGVTKAYKEQGVLSLQTGEITITASFKVRLADHDIKIPAIVFKNIAEIVDVKVHATYEPQKETGAADNTGKKPGNQDSEPGR